MGNKGEKRDAVNDRGTQLRRDNETDVREILDRRSNRQDTRSALVVR